MTRVLLDSSCLVAAVCTWHEFHERTCKDLEKRHRNGNEIVMAAPALVEAYSVLTRLPLPHRISPKDAFKLLEANWGRHEIVALTGKQYWTTLREAEASGISGGSIYDAVIFACARRGTINTLLTWNMDHFARFKNSEMSIRSPGEGD